MERELKKQDEFYEGLEKMQKSGEVNVDTSYYDKLVTNPNAHTLHKIKGDTPTDEELQAITAKQNPQAFVPLAASDPPPDPDQVMGKLSDIHKGIDPKILKMSSRF